MIQSWCYGNGYGGKNKSYGFKPLEHNPNFIVKYVQIFHTFRANHFGQHHHNTHTVLY